MAKIWKWYRNGKKTEPKDYERVPDNLQQNQENDAEGVPVVNAQLKEPNTTIQITAPQPTGK